MDHGPLDCGQVFDRIDQYLDGELSHAERRDLEVHLEACLPCADVSTFNGHLKAIVRDRCEESAPEALKERIRVFLEG